MNLEFCLTSFTGFSKFQNINMGVANKVEYDLVYWSPIKLLRKLYQLGLKEREKWGKN